MAVHPRTILVVEASGTQRALIREQLERLGYSVCQAADAAGARREMSEGRPDAVILAWEIPGAPGPELISEWAAEPDLRWTPVLMLTSHADPAKIRAALEAGATDYLKKPFEPVELDARLRNALRIADLQSELNRLACHDGLTGLFNRRAFSERFAPDFARARRYGNELTVAILDIDHFKRVNDNYGHDVGDRVLVSFSARLAAGVREVDLVARWGGEEFVVLFPETGALGARVCLSRLREAAPRPDGNATPVVSFSAGVASLLEVACDSPEALLKAADEALYRAKESGRDRVEVAHR